MFKFYFLLWVSWVVRVVLCSLFLATFFALLLTLFIYMKQGFASIDKEIMDALFDVWKFWFAIALNAAVLIALFRSVKYLFNHPHAGYMLKLNNGDLVKIWRKWFMLLIWLVGSLMVLAVLFTYIFSFYESLFDWFNIYILYAFILFAGYLSFIFLSSRCKSVRIVKC